MQQEDGLAQACSSLSLLPGTPQEVDRAVAGNLAVRGGRKESEQE
jgi:hypothetical protein